MIKFTFDDIRAKLYVYLQNPAGGDFVISDKVDQLVAIEAFSAEEANNRATLLGIYFDGVHKGIDCSCCGDRWLKKSDTDIANIYEYNKDISIMMKDINSNHGDDSGKCFLLNGTLITYDFENDTESCQDLNNKTTTSDNTENYSFLQSISKSCDFEEEDDANYPDEEYDYSDEEYDYSEEDDFVDNATIEYGETIIFETKTPTDVS